ncbi:MAG TPA: hypothetical protein PKD85_03350 [Saprospiraceae bacterium]|nr:hypothetical protein [Saprospiraceae bacterium]
MIIIRTNNILAQKTYVNTILDNKNEVVGGATVIIMIDDSIMHDFTLSEKNGLFRIELPLCLDNFSIIINHISYEEVRIPCKELNEENKIVMKPRLRSLEELIITGRRSYKIGDTIEYKMDSLRETYDTNLEQALSRIPGIEIMHDGKIFHNGLPISKFYVNNLDLLEGSYTIATRQINPQYIESVEVLLNHQHKNILKNIEIPINAAINIKIKGKILTTSSIVSGISVEKLNHLWQSGSFAFKNKFQFNLNTASNNAGRSPENLFQNHYNNSDAKPQSFNIPIGLYVSAPVTPLNEQERHYKNNRTNVANLSLLSKISKSQEFKIKLGYQKNKLRNIGQNNREFNLNNSKVKFNDSISNMNNLQKIDAQMVYEVNSKKLFMRNDINGSIGNNDDQSIGNYNNISATEVLDKREYDIKLQNETILKLKEKPRKINFLLTRNSTRQELLVSPLQFFDRDDGNIYFINGEQILHQKKNQLSSNGSKLKLFKHFYYKNNYSGTLTDVKYFTQLIGSESDSNIKVFGNRYLNDYRLREANVSLVQSIHKNVKFMELEIGFPVQYKYLNAKKRNGNEPLALLSGLEYSPYLNLKNQWTSLRYDYSSTLSALNTSFAEGLFLASYRILSQGTFNFRRINSNILSGNVKFPIKSSSFFNSIGFKYSTFISGVTENNLIDANTQGVNIIDQKSINSVLNLSSATYLYSFSKALKTDFETSFTNFRTDIAFNGNLKEQNLYTGVIKLNTNLLYKQFIGTLINEYSTIVSETNQLNLFRNGTVLFFDMGKTGKLISEASILYYSKKSSNFILDLTYKLNIPRSKVLFVVEATNLLNQTYYNMLTRNIIFSESSQFLLRERQILLRAEWSFRN